MKSPTCWSILLIDHLKIQGMCEKVIEKDLQGLNYVPDHLKT